MTSTYARQISQCPRSISGSQAVVDISTTQRQSYKNALNVVKSKVMTQRDAAATYRIPWSTIKNKLKNKFQNKPDRPKIFTDQEESSFVAHITALSEFGFPPLFVAGSPQLAAVAVGGAFTYPSILLQQLSGNQSSIVLDFNTASWIGSIHGLAGIPSIFLPVIMQWQGRRTAFIIACFISIIGWIVAFTSSTPQSLLISESLHGLGNSSILAVSLLSISEMVAPSLRNVSMLTYPMMQGFGMTICGVLGRYLHWKILSMILCVPATVALIMACLWPESPSWLAYKGRFKECEEAFIWLRGEDDVAKKELQELLRANRSKATNPQNTRRYTNKIRTLLHKNFYLPCFHMFVYLYLLYSCGSMVICIYTVKVIQSATSNENAAYYGSICLNVLVFIGVVVGTLLVRRFLSKSVLLLSTIGLVVSLLLASFFIHLQTIDVLSKDSIVGLCFLVLYVISTSVGVIPIALTLAAELIPVKHRGVGGAIYVIISSLLHSFTLKTAPYCFLYLTFSGTILIYAANSILCGIYIWKYIPETKGKTLQQIEDYYTDGSFDQIPELINQTERLNTS